MVSRRFLKQVILANEKFHGKRILAAHLLMLVSAFAVWAQTFETDPNPDSPAPILVAAPDDAARAFAIVANRNASAPPPQKAFAPGTRVVLYAENLPLGEGENANALRLAVTDARRRQFRFPVLQIEPVAGRAAAYRLTVELKDTLRFYKQPKAGDVFVELTWRGLSSNRLRLGYGKTGGALKDDADQSVSDSFAAPASVAPHAEEANRVGYLHSGDRTRFLEQATFGPTPELDRRVRRIGLRVWLNEQFNAAYPTVPFPDIALMPSNAPGDCNGAENPNLIPPDPPDIYPNCRRDRYTLFPVQNWFFKEAFYGDAQLRHRTAWALSQMWVVSGVDTQQSSHFVNYYQVLTRNAFGNYRTLMREMTLNAAMGNYLDMARSTKNSPNENYAREILQLFSIGVHQLNQDGTIRRDANGEPIPTYNQATVNAFTKVFTGWSFCEGAANICPNRTLGVVNFKDPLLLIQANHDQTAKTLLDYPNAVNKEIEANLDGNAELEKALDNIYNHPNVAPFVSRFLIQHFVTSDPTPAFVGRISAVFNQNRTNPAQLREVIRAILLDPEARGNSKTDPHYGKLREPVQLATNLLRQFNVRAADGAANSDGGIAYLLAPMGQNVFYSPNVFNYYAPDYVVPGPGLNAPEFGLMTTGTAIARMNFINQILFSRVNPNQNTETGTAIDLSEMLALATNDQTNQTLIETLNQKLMHGALTVQNKALILAALNAVPRSNPLMRVRMAIYLIATSSQYQVQR